MLIVKVLGSGCANRKKLEAAAVSPHGRGPAVATARRATARQGWVW